MHHGARQPVISSAGVRLADYQSIEGVSLVARSDLTRARHPELVVLKVADLTLFATLLQPAVLRDE